VAHSESIVHWSGSTPLPDDPEKLPALNDPAVAALDDDWAALLLWLLLASDELLAGAPPLAAFAPPSELLVLPDPPVCPPPLPSSLSPSPNVLSVPVAQLTTSRIPDNSAVGANHFAE